MTGAVKIASILGLAAGTVTVQVLSPEASQAVIASRPAAQSPVHDINQELGNEQDQTNVDVYVDWQPVAVNLTGHSSVGNWSDY